MTTLGQGGAGWRRWAGLGLLLACLAAGPSCGSFPGPLPDVPLHPFGDGTRTQEGELTIRDGEELGVRYDKVFKSAPRLVIVELRNAWSQDRPYSKSDFRFVKPDATGFRVVNDHFEPGRRTWRVIDPSVQADYDGIAKLSDGDFAIVNRDAADRTWLVAFTSYFRGTPRVAGFAPDAVACGQPWPRSVAHARG